MTHVYQFGSRRLHLVDGNGSYSIDEEHMARVREVRRAQEANEPVRDDSIRAEGGDPDLDRELALEPLKGLVLFAIVAAAMGAGFWIVQHAGPWLAEVLR